MEGIVGDGTSQMRLVGVSGVSPKEYFYQSSWQTEVKPRQGDRDMVMLKNFTEITITDG